MNQFDYVTNSKISVYFKYPINTSTDLKNHCP